MNQEGYNQVEELLWFQNILDIEIREFKNRPTQNKLDVLMTACLRYMESVETGKLKLPKYIR